MKGVVEYSDQLQGHRSWCFSGSRRPLTAMSLTKSPMGAYSMGCTRDRSVTKNSENTVVEVYTEIGPNRNSRQDGDYRNKEDKLTALTLARCVSGKTRAVQTISREDRCIWLKLEEVALFSVNDCTREIDLREGDTSCTVDGGRGELPCFDQSCIFEIGESNPYRYLGWLFVDYRNEQCVLFVARVSRNVGAANRQCAVKHRNSGELLGKLHAKVQWLSCKTLVFIAGDGRVDAFAATVQINAGVTALRESQYIVRAPERGSISV